MNFMVFFVFFLLTWALSTGRSFVRSFVVKFLVAEQTHHSFIRQFAALPQHRRIAIKEEYRRVTSITPLSLPRT
jgi:hypothetical protein